MNERLLIVGDALLDREVEGRSERLCPDAPVPVVDQRSSIARPGGAGLAALLAARSGIATTLVTALARDEAGGELARSLLAAGVELIDLGLEGATPEKVRVFDRGRPVVRVDRGGGSPRTEAAHDISVAGAVREADGILVSDYGNGVAGLPWVRRALAARADGTPLVWDPHPRGPAPIRGATLVTPNHAEAAARGGRLDGGAFPWDPDRLGRGEAPTLVAPTELAAALRSFWEAEAVVVTCGGDDAALALTGGVVCVPSDPVAGDPCGAGDRYAVEAAWLLTCGSDAPVAAWLAGATATSFVAEGGARAVGPVVSPERRSAGTVVATGGCFDLLHAGHLRTLRAARALGDRLVVLLNGDASVRLLKGPERPLVGELERAELLAALDCVDEVVIFDEETPAEALALLRPDVWVKGGDYALADLPEREALAGWGGRTVLLPFLAGRSTTRLIEKVGQYG